MTHAPIKSFFYLITLRHIKQWHQGSSPSPLSLVLYHFLSSTCKSCIMTCNSTFPLGEWTGGRKFDFDLLFQYFLKIYNTCPSDPRLVSGTQLLTLKASMEFAGETFAWTSWTAYDPGSIMARLLTWKTPLVQLVFSFSRMPLGLNVELFTLNHLIGDPIDTLASLMYTLELCQARAMRFKDEGMTDEEWKAKALIETSIAECCIDPPPTKISTISKWRRKARQLAANRTTKFLPITVALLIFNGSFGLAYGRTVSLPEGPNNWIPIELHSIAFSASFLWLTETVLLSALIGVPQTEASVPSILKIESAVPPAINLVAAGALPSFRPDMWRRGNRRLQSLTVSRWRVLALTWVATVLVASGTFVAWAISYTIPPQRFGCRHTAQGAILSLWVANLVVGICLSCIEMSPKKRFVLTYTKDAVSSLVVIFLVIITQWGVFNRSVCWVGDEGGIQLPQAPSVNANIRSRINVEYPCIIFGGIAFRFLACKLIATYYRHAIRVFVQRDDGESNVRRLSTCRSRAPRYGRLTSQSSL